MPCAAGKLWANSANVPSAELSRKANPLHVQNQMPTAGSLTPLHRRFECGAIGVAEFSRQIENDGLSDTAFSDLHARLLSRAHSRS
jgi:hypothetical protein